MVKIELTNVNSTCITRPEGSKSKKLIFCLLSTFLLFCLIISPAAAAVEWKISPSDPAVGDTLKIKGTASSRESIRAEVSFEQEIPVSEGRYQYLLENVKIPKGNDNLFTVRVDGVKNLHVGVKKLSWINMRSKASDGVATISKGHVPSLTYKKILFDGDAEKQISSVNLKVTVSQTLKADSKGKFEFIYDTSSMPAGNYTIKIGNSERTIELIPKKGKSVAGLSASPNQYTLLKEQFTGRNAGSPISWKKFFGN